MKLLALFSLLMAALLLSAFFATAAKALGQQDQKNDGRGGTGIKDLVRREKAIPGVHVVQNGCAEMQASGIAVTGWRRDLTERCSRGHRAYGSQIPVRRNLGRYALVPGIEKNNFSRRRAVNRSRIFELFDSSNVNGRASGLLLPRPPVGAIPLKL
jgi:hypothetical protein